MEQLILWFNILGFTFLFASLGTAYMVYGRSKPKWLGSYLVYLALYAFFTLFNTYYFFSQVYLPPMKPFFNSLTTFLTFFIALLLLIVVPRFIFSLLPRDKNRKHKILIYAMAGAFLIMMLLSLMYPEWQLDRAGSAFLNGYLGIITFGGLVSIRSVKDRKAYGVVIPFLYLSSFFYFIVLLESIILPMLLPPLLNGHINILTAGLICFLWGVMTLAYMIIKKYPYESPGTAVLTENYASRFGITPREKEIITLLLQGKSNKEIGESLFVSPRTVETHIYNVYRKCSVKNKLELAHHIASNT